MNLPQSIIPSRNGLREFTLKWAARTFILISERCKNLDKGSRFLREIRVWLPGTECSAGSRNIVHRVHLDEYLEKIKEKVSKIKDLEIWLSPDNWLGPVINEKPLTKKFLIYIKN
jgi:acyl-CoA reductase-like NAD-dependent aldehyde dehydrogenase